MYLRMTLNTYIYWWIAVFKALGTLQYFVMKLKKVGVLDDSFQNVKFKQSCVCL